MKIEKTGYLALSTVFWTTIANCRLLPEGNSQTSENLFGRGSKRADWT
jgi:hypothetical protein